RRGCARLRRSGRQRRFGQGVVQGEQRLRRGRLWQERRGAAPEQAQTEHANPCRCAKGRTGALAGGRGHGVAFSPGPGGRLGAPRSKLLGLRSVCSLNRRIEVASELNSASSRSSSGKLSLLSCCTPLAAASTVRPALALARPATFAIFSTASALAAMRSIAGPSFSLASDVLR